MPLALRPALRTCAATALAATLAATTVLPATAAPGLPQAPAAPAVEATPSTTAPGRQAAPVVGKAEQSIPVDGISADALPEEVPAELPEEAITGRAGAPVPSPSSSAEAEPVEQELAETALPEDDVDELAALSEPTATKDFLIAGLTWDIDGTDPVSEASIRVREGGEWTDWSSLEVHDGDERPGAARTGTEPLVTNGADGIQVRVLTASGKTPAGLEVALIDPGTSETDGELAPASPAGAAAPLDAPAGRAAAGSGAPQAASSVPEAAPASGPSPATGAEASFAPALAGQQGLLTGTAAAEPVAYNTDSTADALKPAIVTRAQWGADESIVRDFGTPSTDLKALYIHHTAGSNSYTPSGAYAQIRGIFTYHAKTLGWGDIGYQFLVDKYGTIYQGRRGSIDAPVMGAQAGGFNTDTIGVSAMGNYQEAAAPAAMVDAIERVLAWQAYRYGVDPTGTTRLTQSGKGTARWTSGTTVTVPTILGHKVTNFTSCPGQYLDAKIPSIRSSVDQRVNAALTRYGQATPLTAPTLPWNRYVLSTPGLKATARWNAVPGATGYQIMYRAVPHDGGAVGNQPWIAGKTVSTTSTTLTNEPGETAQYAVRAVANGAVGPQAYLGQHTGPIAWDDDDLYTARMTSISAPSGIEGRAVRTQGKDSVIRVEDTEQVRRVSFATYVPSGGYAHLDVYQDDYRYVGTIKILQSGSAHCALSLPGGSNVRLVSRSSTPVTITRLLLNRQGQTSYLDTADRCVRGFADNPPGSSFYDAVDWMQTAGVSQGYAATNTYGKTRRISRGESVAFVYRYMDPAYTPTSTRPFSDVRQGDTFYEPISWARDRGIAKGYGNGTFGVGEDVTRAEFASFLYRAARPGYTVPRTRSFPDVPTWSAHHAAISWMESEGLAGGYDDGTFRPDRDITRAEVAAILYRYDRR
ncbi:hypothetical protein E7744_08405 [Citricoccus sp. SGAir0253]|uniref:S-layer homology domain-containing protein n=1 Tax=Citricoccus sp. SGAir0253 TaxID=2567881 RepID=UPI0010CD5C16|nr:S-layer homology domain-containing protein [Citricoccus sp. SGAir0253]QCU78193.1 hypothetical protein E7744_08405 [Citricoccus sp. SGAir0253]